MQCRGERANGDVFLANVFFSTYNTAAGPRLAALVVDASEEMRDREETSLQQLMAGSRILVGAVSHEVRNVCGAIGVIYENLARNGGLRGNKDFEALGSLVETLHKIASLELKQGKKWTEAAAIDLAEILDDLRIVLEPFCHEAGIEVDLGHPSESAARMGRSAQPAAGAAQLDEEQRAGAGRRGREAHRRFRLWPQRRGLDPGGRHGSWDQVGRETFSTLSEGRGIDRFRALPIARLRALISRRFAARSGVSGCAFVIDLAAAGPESETPISGRSRPLNMEPIRLLLLDDHVLFRESLSRLLASEPDFEMAGHCGTVAEALEMLRGSPVDVLLLDFDLGDDLAAHFGGAARAAGFEGKILMVTAGMTAAESSFALTSGASGIFLKHNSPGLSGAGDPHGGERADVGGSQDRTDAGRRRAPTRGSIFAEPADYEGASRCCRRCSKD